jgi:hypothetical protein
VTSTSSMVVHDVTDVNSIGHMYGVEQNEVKVKAIAADLLCIMLLELVWEFRHSKVALYITVSKLALEF